MKPSATFTLSFVLLSAVAGMQGCTSSATTERMPEALSTKEKLGRALFFDTRLSDPAGQSCASCHSPEHGFSHPDASKGTSEGAVKGLFGNRNVPTVSYAAYIPELHKEIEDGDALYVGGLFHDGRQPTLEKQLVEPFTNPVEMANKDMAEVTQKVIDAGYTEQFEALFGKGALKNPDLAATFIADAIAAYERSKEVSPFSSKYDAYLAGKAELTALEQKGLELFNAEDKANCAACHSSEINKETGFPPLFTDFTYDNLGVPGNTANPFLKNPAKFNPHGKTYVDNGLGKTVKDAAENGKFRVPTLRNIAKTAPYMHNGVFATLEDVVQFYNTRDKDTKWGQPEVTDNVNKDELGDLKLKDDEVKAIVAFMKTLTDGYQPN